MKPQAGYEQTTAKRRWEGGVDASRFVRGWLAAVPRLIDIGGEYRMLQKVCSCPVCLGNNPGFQPFRDVNSNHVVRYAGGVSSFSTCAPPSNRRWSRHHIKF